MRKMENSQMNIYILNATINGKLLAEILCRESSVKGLIALNENGNRRTQEYYDYTDFCKERNIECIKVDSYNLTSEEDKNKLLKLDIDLLIVASWQRLIPSWLISKCRIGAIGAHGSHEGITRGRGRSPQNWALLMGKEDFSLSIFWIEEEADNGAIIDTREFKYLPTDNILVSYIKVNLYKADMILKNIKNGRIARKDGKKQSKEGLYLPQRKKEDGMIDWNRDAVEINNMVRALTRPYPGAFTCHGDTEFLIWSSHPVVVDVSYLYESVENGTVISILDRSILVKCGKNLLLVDSCTNRAEIYEGMVFESGDFKKQIRTIIGRHKEKYGTPLSRLVLDEAGLPEGEAMSEVGEQG